MSLEAIAVTMTVEEGRGLDLPAREVLRTILRDVLPVCVLPLEVSGSWGEEEVRLTAAGDSSWREVPLWRGETVDGDRLLTRIEAGTEGIADELLAAAGGRQAETFDLELAGAVYHHPPQDAGEPGWFGRAVRTFPGIDRGQLLYLVWVDCEWSRWERSVSFSFPLAGYPLTAQLPAFDAEDRIRSTRRDVVVAANRNHFIPAVARARPALGLAAADVDWQIDHDLALLPRDRRALERWQEMLRREELPEGGP